MRLRAVVFDMDGVLLNSEPLHLDASCIMLRRYGVDIDHIDVTAGSVGADYETMWREFAHKYNINKELSELVREQFDCTYEYFQNIDINEMDGLTDFILDLKRNGVACAVASASPYKVVALVLQKLGIDQYMDTFCAAEMVLSQKPDPEIYNITTSRLNADKPECIVIEDSPIGVNAAKAAGLKCIALNSSRLPEEKLKKADLIIDSFSEINYDTLKHLISAEG